MKQIELVFGTYNGLPHGSTDVEFENAYQRSYKPFLTTLYKFPTVRSTIYYSGIVLSWLQSHHPEFLMLLNDMVKRSQLELLGGAFYEPILPLIPSSDRSGQIEMLTTYLRKRFGKRPRGFWVPEFAWEPSLPASLKNCGMEYTFLDEASFESAGISAKLRYRSVKTEDQGKSLEVFPNHTRLTPSVLTVGSDPLDPSQYLKRVTSWVPSDEQAVIVLIDQGEAMGLWDESHERFYGSGWLESFFEVLSADEQIATELPREISQRPRRAERCYFGSSHVESLTRWWLLPNSHDKEIRKQLRKRSRALLPAGTFRQLLGRYPESSNLYAKMMHVNILVNQIRGDRYRKQAAREELWKAQSGYPYWHGKIDGIYRNSIRKTAYTALIEAEKIARERGIFKQHISKEDIDLDGLEEYLIKGNVVNAYIDPVGGCLFELDYLPVSWNYLDTMGRYEEPYHDTLVPKARAVFDSLPRRAFTDRFTPRDFSMKDFLDGDADGDSLADLVYEITDYKRDHMEVTLAASRGQSISLAKTYRLAEDELTVSYVITNIGDADLTEAFTTEINLSFASNNEEFLQLRANTTSGTVITLRDVSKALDVESFEARDLRNAMTISASVEPMCELWSNPLVTSWYSRGGQRTGYQCSTFVLKWPVELPVDSSMVCSVRLTFRN